MKQIFEIQMENLNITAELIAGLLRQHFETVYPKSPIASGCIKVREIPSYISNSEYLKKHTVGIGIDGEPIFDHKYYTPVDTTDCIRTDCVLSDTCDRSQKSCQGFKAKKDEII